MCPSLPNIYFERFHDHVPEHDNIQETIYFTSVDAIGALHHIKANYTSDAIFQCSESSDNAVELKNLAKESLFHLSFTQQN